MLIITGECQYTLLGLGRLLAPRAPTLMSTAQWMADDEVPPGTALLMVASRDQALADLLPVAEKARHDCVRRLALMGFSGQGVFMNTCGLAPDCILGPKMPPALLQRCLLDWLSFRSSRRQSGWLRGRPPEVLSPREREVLRLALSGVPVPVASEDLGITPKTFYTLRMSALNRLGLKNIRALLANPVTGVPDPTSRYNRLLGDYSRQAVFC